MSKPIHLSTSLQRHVTLPRLAVEAGTVLLALGCVALLFPSVLLAQSAPPSQIKIYPLNTVVEEPASGYFSDPYPIRLASSAGPGAPLFFCGTTKAILADAGPISPGAFSEQSAITIDRGTLGQQANTLGATLPTAINGNIFQDDAGTWHMAVTFYVHNPSTYTGTSPWTVVAHAHPTDDAVPPAHWSADTLLVGSLTQQAAANYDGKYFQDDNGTLYLVYSKQLSASPAHDGIVAQAMGSPTQLATSAPTTLLAPENADGGFNSEYFFLNKPNAQFKLIETGNITKVGGKYAMAYSTGAFDETDYKAGVAWSDTFLPAAGGSYRRVLLPDTAGVWGQPNHAEVRYLLQAQESAWPNYVAAQVLAPGVPSIVERDGAWYLCFAGFDPADAPVDPATGYFVPGHRRPYYVRLNVAVPAGAAVAAATDADLATWLTPLPADGTVGAHPAFFHGEMYLSNGVYYLTFSDGNPFGYYSYAYFPNLYHFDLGFVAFDAADDRVNGAYLYDFTSGAWWYTNPALFPYLYDFGLNAWLYYFPNPNDRTHYTTAPRYFYDFGTGQIITR